MVTGLFENNQACKVRKSTAGRYNFKYQCWCPLHAYAPIVFSLHLILAFHVPLGDRPWLPAVLTSGLAHVWIEPEIDGLCDFQSSESRLLCRILAFRMYVRRRPTEPRFV